MWYYGNSGKRPGGNGIETGLWMKGTGISSGKIGAFNLKRSLIMDNKFNRLDNLLKKFVEEKKTEERGVEKERRCRGSAGA